MTNDGKTLAENFKKYCINCGNLNDNSTCNRSYACVDNNYNMFTPFIVPDGEYFFIKEKYQSEIVDALKEIENTANALIAKDFYNNAEFAGIIKAKVIEIVDMIIDIGMNPLNKIEDDGDCDD